MKGVEADVELSPVTEELLNGKPRPPETADKAQDPGSQQLVPQPLQGIGRQLFASFAVAMGSMLVGFSSGYTSPALISMADPNSTLSVTYQQAAWVGSLMPLAALFGGVAGGLLIEYLGRRTTILCTAPPFALAWLTITLAQNVGMIYAGRIISGFCVGVTSLGMPVYMGETIQPEVRGMLGLISTTLGNIGILLVFVLGKYLNWRNLALTGALLSVPYGACTWMAPESPHWFIAKGRNEEAEAALRWLRGGEGADIAVEMRTTVEGVSRSAQHGGAGLSALFSRTHWRPVSIALGLMLFQQFSGINAVIFYTVRIFQDAGSTIDEFVSTMVVGAVNLGAVVLATALIDRLGRKVLLAASAAAMTLSLAKLGTFFYLSDRSDVDVSGYGWLPLTSFVVFVIGFSVGFGPVPWLMMGEILPADIRGLAASLATAVNWASTFVVTKTFPDVVAGVGSHAAFWGFGAVCLGAFVFVVTCVPETRGRTLADIERRLAGAPPPRRQRRTTLQSVAEWTASMASIKPMPTGA